MEKSFNAYLPLSLRAVVPPPAAEEVGVAGVLLLTPDGSIMVDRLQKLRRPQLLALPEFQGSTCLEATAMRHEVA